MSDEKQDLLLKWSPIPTFVQLLVIGSGQPTPVLNSKAYVIMVPASKQGMQLMSNSVHVMPNSNER